jgi:hypothetical protein
MGRNNPCRCARATGERRTSAQARRGRDNPCRCARATGEHALSFKKGLTGRHKFVLLHPQFGIAIRRQSPAFPCRPFPRLHLPARNLSARNLSAFINPPHILHRTSAQARMGRNNPCRCARATGEHGFSFSKGLTCRHKFSPLHPQPGIAIRRQSPTFLCHHLPAQNLSAFINPPQITIPPVPCLHSPTHSSLQPTILGPTQNSVRAFAGESIVESKRHEFENHSKPLSDPCEFAVLACHFGSRYDRSRKS